MSSTRPTESFLSLTVSQAANIAFEAETYSTLNEVLSAGNVAPPNDGSYPKIQYLALGVGGADFALGSGSVSTVNYKIHSPTDATAFNLIPFQLVPATADLSSTDRAKYRLRVPVSVNNIDYFAYYLKVIDTTGSTLSKRLLTISNGQQVGDVEFTSTASRLSPTPVNIDNTNVNVTNGTQLIIQTTVNVPLSTEDLNAIINACTILFGSGSAAVISEIMFCSGWDKTVTVGTGQNAITYTEAQCAQVMAFQNSLITAFDTSSTTIPFSISQSVPMPTSI